ncbi:uncharacterized protein [Fopius arisanus]|uniref:Uncharacterized protein n=1 Tax=Fopius arisanus TaxID=64838 RepID=A0A9R1TI10_9HYME|nr:PREDICTED: uncharacterized protein LOC105271228 [Fopius arisanus]
MDDNEKLQAGSGRCMRVVSQPTTPTSPTLNLMEQLLLAKMERHSIADNDQSDIAGLSKKIGLLRTESMDSQTSASTFSSAQSGDSVGNRYCKCDDCLLGIVDKHRRLAPLTGRKKAV